MKPSLLTLLLTLSSAPSLGLSPPEKSYDILMLLPVGSKSHKNFLTAVAEVLGERGHKVVMLSGYPASSRNANVTEITHGLKDLFFEEMNVFESGDDIFAILTDVLPAMARKIYEVPQVKELYDKRKTFDLIIMDHLLNEIMFPFVHGSTYITIAASGLDPMHSAIFGNVHNPSYVPGMLEDYPSPMGMWHRFLNTIQHITMPIYWRSFVLSLVQKEISTMFPNLPSLLEIEHNQSLALINSHFSMDMTLPLLPSQVEVGAIHCRPAKSLPEDLESFISGAGPEGVVYFSLGTVSLGKSMPVVYRNMFLEAFKRLKQRVVWKYEDPLEGVSDNVLVRKWLPQQDILGHPQVKVFLSHGGLLSTQETLYHATPVVALPVFADQPRNAQKIQRLGLGVALVWEELSVEKILAAIQEVISNPRYEAAAREVSEAVRDQPQPPRDRAVFWTEYVIRHRGARHLKSLAADLSWTEFLMLDVLLVLHITGYVIFLLLRRLCHIVCGWSFSPKDGRKTKRE